MSPKMPFSPRIYWLIYTLLFFFISDCTLTKSLFRKASSEAESPAILWNKYPKKLNPKFYSEGSTYYKFVERNSPSDGGKINEWELTFLVFEKDFLSSIKDVYPKAETHLYKLNLRKRSGTYTKSDSQNDFIAKFSNLESIEISADDLKSLLLKQNNTKFSSTNINEMVSYSFDGEGAYLTSENITSNQTRIFEWKNDIPSSENAPRSVFLYSNASEKPTKFSSTHYDYFQNQFEVSRIEPNKLFYKSIYIDSKFEIYFLPPLSNNISTKPKEPVGLKRIGDFLLREETQ